MNVVFRGKIFYSAVCLFENESFRKLDTKGFVKCEKFLITVKVKFTMCRMFAFSGVNKAALQSIYESLSDVSKSDPLRQSVSNEPLSHRDGWGYAASISGSLYHFRSASPIFETTHRLPLCDQIIVHARNAARGEPFGVASAHPFHASSEDYDFYLAHNGWIDKHRIKRYENRRLNSITDTEVFLQIMARQEGGPEERMALAVEEIYSCNALKSGLNLLVLAVSKANTVSAIYVYNDAVEQSEYLQLYNVVGRGYSTVVSSSLVQSKYFPVYSRSDRLTWKTIYRLDSNGITERKLVSV